MEEVKIVTARLQWVSLRDAVAADDTPISVFKVGNMPAVGTSPETGQNGSIDLASIYMKKANGVMIMAWGEGNNDEAITGYKLYGTVRENGPIIEVLSGVMTLGAQACTVHPLTGVALTNNLWFDTITVTDGLWAGLVEILDSNSDKICMLKFDTLILDRLFLEYDENVAGPTAFSAIITGY